MGYKATGYKIKIITSFWSISVRMSEQFYTQIIDLSGHIPHTCICILVNTVNVLKFLTFSS